MSVPPEVTRLSWVVELDDKQNAVTVLQPSTTSSMSNRSGKIIVPPNRSSYFSKILKQFFSIRIMLVVFFVIGSYKWNCIADLLSEGMSSTGISV